MLPETPGDPSVPAPRASPVVVADLEGTCTRGETWRGVGRWLAEHGRRGRYRRFLAPRLAATPLVRLGVISRQEFRDRWIREADRVAALAAGAPVRAAYGDSLADVPLLELALEAVAVAPDRDLRPVAIARGWRILENPPGVVR